jgi:Xaa-Pro dipeptidase
MTTGAQPIGEVEYRARIAKAQAYMRANKIDAVYLNGGSSLLYFTGVHWHPSERMVGAILPASGDVEFIAPKFEEGTLNDFMVVKGAVNCWQEHESPTQLFINLLDRICPGGTAKVGIDETTPFFLFDKMRRLGNRYEFIDAKDVTAHGRMRKSAAEIALMQRAKDMTLEVHKATASILHEGITTTEVGAFIEQAHRKVGAPGNTFCIVLFGAATAFPHGVKDPQTLKANDVVLIDIGCKLHDYQSDITRTYVYGEPNERQRKFWDIEKAAQAAAFAAAKLGAPCGEPDRAARRVLIASGLGPDYNLPGLPHRTGHGIGLDVHEWPYLVGSDETPLDVGMCFSNEPMICLPGEFGIRHEDHFYMTEKGPRWFTQPAHTVDDPFGLER